MKEKISKKNQSVEKAFQIIEVMAKNPGPMRLMDIAKGVQLPASTVLRFMSTLTSCGYIGQNPETSKYFLTVKLANIGNKVISQLSIRDVIRPFLMELSEKCHESVCLAIEDDMMAVYIDVVEGPDKMLRTLQRIGKSAPLHSTGVGKLLLLNYDEIRLETLLNIKGFSMLTNKTITTLEALMNELEKIKKQGFAIDDEECELGARCVAAPIRDFSGKVIACISVSGPTSRITWEKVDSIKEIIIDISNRISNTLGYSGS